MALEAGIEIISSEPLADGQAVIVRMGGENCDFFAPDALIKAMQIINWDQKEA